MAFAMHLKDKERYLASLAKWAHLLDIATSGPEDRPLRLGERFAFNEVERSIAKAVKNLSKREGWEEPVLRPVPKAAKK